MAFKVVKRVGKPVKSRKPRSVKLEVEKEIEDDGMVIEDEIGFEEKQDAPQAVKPTVELPVYQGIRITRILDSGHNKTHFRCEGVDGNGNVLTMHVSRDLFNPQG